MHISIFVIITIEITIEITLEITIKDNLSFILVNRIKFFKLLTVLTKNQD